MRNLGIDKRSRGKTLIFVVFVTAVVVMFVVVLNASVLRDVRTQVRQSDDSFALQASQSGIDRAIWCLNHVAECSQPYTGETATIGGARFTTTVTTIGGERQVTSIGDTNQEQREVQVVLTTNPVMTGASFHYGIQTGIGGLSMEQNGVVKGSVYSNGPITGGNKTTIEADASAAAIPALAVDQSQTVNGASCIVGRSAANADAGQSFVASATTLLTKVSVNFKKQGGPQNATLRIAHDMGGRPETTSVVSWPIVTSTIATSLAWYDYTLASPIPIIAGRKYWIVFDSASTNFLNYWVWTCGDGDGSYPAGDGLYSNNFAASTPWSPAGNDFMFKTWTGGAQTSTLSTMVVKHDAYASAISDSTIQHDAFYQTINNSTVSGTSHPGSTPPPQVPFPLALDQIADWEATAAAAGPEVNPNGTLTLGNGAELPSEKINGNLAITQNATVTLKGTVWVKGNFTVEQNVKINLDPSFGSNGAVIVVDNPDAPKTSGRVVLDQNVKISGTGVTGSYIMIVSTNRGIGLGAASAMQLNQGIIGGIFYSTDGMIDMLQNANVKSLTGQAIHLGQGAIINYDQGMISTTFTDGPGGAWTAKPETWREVKG